MSLCRGYAAAKKLHWHHFLFPCTAQHWLSFDPWHDLALQIYISHVILVRSFNRTPGLQAQSLPQELRE